MTDTLMTLCIACGAERELNTGACGSCQDAAGEAIAAFEAGIPSASTDSAAEDNLPSPCPDASGYDPAKKGGE